MDKRLLNLSSQEVARILVKFGFIISRQKGSHIQYIGVINGIKRRVTLIVNQNSFTLKTMKSMIDQSGLTETEWLKFI